MTSRKKLNQPISPQFEPNQEEWDQREESTISEIREKYLRKNNKVKAEMLPHKKSIEEIIKDVRHVFLNLLKLVMDNKNPTQYIMSEKKNQFAFCIIVIFIGVFLLLLSNIL